MAPLVSIIIPVRNDTPALARLLGQLPAGHPAIEVIVAAGGAEDGAFQQLRRARGDVVWVESRPGRAMQLNAGAAHATGEWLWFVHADSRLPQAWLDAFHALTTDPLIIGGSFAFRLDSTAWQARLIERAVATRVRLFGLPYGDQGIFVRRSVFASMGAFQLLPLMEDVEFVQRLRRAGPVRHLTLEITTSARRWQRDGWWRRSALNLWLLTQYLVGVSPERLARRYYSEKPYAHQKTC